MRYSQYTDFKDFCEKNNLSYPEGLDYLQKELKRFGVEIGSGK